MKKICKFLFIIILLVACFFTSIGVNKVLIADSGFDSSYDSGGSWDSGSSWDSSSSWDSDYSSGASGEGSFVSLMIFIIVFFFVIIPIINNKNKTRVSSNINVKSVTEEEIRKYIKDFDRNKFLQDTFNIYVRVQEAWMNFDLPSVRNILTDEIYNMYESQLETLNIKGQQNVMKDFKMTNARMIDYKVENNIIEITNSMTVEFYDYIIDKANGNVLRGSSNRKIVIDYEMTFIKSLNVKTLDKCPNCGANVNVNSGTLCEYCNSTIILEDNQSFVLSKKKAINQRFK